MLAENHGAWLQVIACLERPHDLSILSRREGEAPATLVAETVEHVREIVAGKPSKIVPDRQIEVAASVGKADKGGATTGHIDALDRLGRAA